MFLSIFDVFKIGIGPSSSHTMGPMVAAVRFIEDLYKKYSLLSDEDKPVRINCRLYGSLAFTGKGHGTDQAVILGLIGCKPDTLDPDDVDTLLARVNSEKHIKLEGQTELVFNPETDLVFDYGPALPAHPNGMILTAFDASDSIVFKETYYSIGGGFVATESELQADRKESNSDESGQGPEHDCPYPFKNATEMMQIGETSGKTVAEMKCANDRK